MARLWDHSVQEATSKAGLYAMCFQNSPSFYASYNATGGRSNTPFWGMHANEGLATNKWTPTSHVFVGGRFAVNGSGNLFTLYLASVPVVNIGILATGEWRYSLNNGAWFSPQPMTGVIPFPGDSIVTRYIEAEFDLVAGIIRIWVDGVLVASKTGITFAQTTCDFVVFGGNSNADPICGVRMQDIYVNDTTGSTNNGREGDVAITGVRPTAVGTYDTDGAVVGAATAWQATNEGVPDDDTSYIELASSGQKRSVNFADLAAIYSSLPVRCVTGIFRARKDDAGDNQLRVFLYRGGSVVNGATVVQSTSYSILRASAGVDPSGGGTLTGTLASLIEAGVERVV